MSRHEEYNSGKHIDDIIRRTTCEKHNGGQGIACFYVFLSTKDGEASEAICNDRILASGFNGKIHPGSLRQKDRGGPKKRF